MQITLRCKHCQFMTVSEKDSDMCLEIDAFEQAIRFVCRNCKKENTIKLSRLTDAVPLPKIGSTRF